MFAIKPLDLYEFFSEGTPQVHESSLTKETFSVLVAFSEYSLGEVEQLSASLVCLYFL